MTNDSIAKASKCGVYTFPQGGDPYAPMQSLRSESKITRIIFIVYTSFYIIRDNRPMAIPTSAWARAVSRDSVKNLRLEVFPASSLKPP